MAVLQATGYHHPSTPSYPGRVMASIPVASLSTTFKPPSTTTAAAAAALCFTRRTATTILATVLLASEALLSNPKPAISFEFGFTAPDQTLEEAEAGLKVHGRELVGIRALIESRSWRETQVALRESSARLKQDLYTIIQSKPGSQRPQLRKLYTTLFNNVTSLDYAARSEDADLVQEHYRNIVAILGDILGRI